MHVSIREFQVQNIIIIFLSEGYNFVFLTEFNIAVTSIVSQGVLDATKAAFCSLFFPAKDRGPWIKSVSPSVLTMCLNIRRGRDAYNNYSLHATQVCTKC